MVGLLFFCFFCFVLFCFVFTTNLEKKFHSNKNGSIGSESGSINVENFWMIVFHVFDEKESGEVPVGFRGYRNLKAREIICKQ